MTDRLTFRNGTPDDLDLMVDLGGAGRLESRLRGMQSASTPLIPTGFWVARRDGEIAACMSLVTYDAAFAFLGFYITRPDFAGRASVPLWKHGSQTVKPTQSASMAW